MPGRQLCTLLAVKVSLLVSIRFVQLAGNAELRTRERMAPVCLLHENRMLNINWLFVS